MPRVCSGLWVEESRMTEAVKRTRPEPAPKAPGVGTRQRILDTAELLFARDGPSAVTLRSIASAADVNVAGVNYYFGSKEKLFEEMFLRRIVPLNEARLGGLAECAAIAQGRPSVQAIVTAYVLPALQLTDSASASARAIIVQYSLGWILAKPEVNRMLLRYYDRVRKEFVAALRHAAPQMSEQDVVWRYYWMGGSVMVSLAVPPGMVELAEHADVQPGYKSIASELIAFLVQGFCTADVRSEPACIRPD